MAFFLIFDEMWIYLLVFSISITMHFLHRLDLGPFRTILHILGFVGVIVHELSHYLLCTLVGVKVEKIRIRYRSRTTGLANPHGFVRLEEYELQSFLQTLLIGIAPLFIHSWLIMVCFNLLQFPGFDDLVYIGLGILIVSLFIGSAPSPSDLRNCYKSFVRSPVYSVYQVCLLGLSFSTIFIVLNVFQLSFSIEFFNYIVKYILITGVYFLLKYSFRGINRFMHKSHSFNRVNLRLITRKRHIPIRPKKLGIEEPHW